MLEGLHQSSLAQEDLDRGQAPPLPSGRGMSPSSASFPDLQGTRLPATTRHAGTFRLPFKIHTPEALRPYLEEDPGSLSVTNSVMNVPLDQSISSTHAKDDRSSGKPLDLKGFKEPRHVEEKRHGLRLVDRAIPKLSSPAAMHLHCSAAPLLPDRPTLPIPEGRNSYCTQSVPPILGLENDQYMTSTYAEPYRSHTEKHSTIIGGLQVAQDEARPYHGEVELPYAMPTILMPSRTMSSQESAQGCPIYAYHAHPRIYCNLDEYTNDDIAKVRNQSQKANNFRHVDHVLKVIPPLQQLPDGFGGIPDHLSFWEQHYPQIDIQQENLAGQKETFNNRFVKELEEFPEEHPFGLDRFCFDIKILEEKNKELQKDIPMRLKASEKLVDTHHGLGTEDYPLNEDAQKGSGNAIRAFQASREKAQYNLEKSKEVVTHGLQAHAELGLPDVSTNVEEGHAKKFAAFNAEWNSRLSEFEIVQANSDQEKKSASETCEQELVKAPKKVDGLDENCSPERVNSALGQNTNQQRLTQRRGDKSRAVQAEGRKEKGTFNDSWEALRADECKLLENENVVLHQEVERLKENWEADKVKFAKALAESNFISLKLSNENANLQRILESYGDRPDFKGRGDA